MISQQFAATVRRAFQKPLRLVLFGLAILLVIAYAPPVHAATITVVQTSDGPANASDCPGTLCTLRDAIAKANSGDTINFAFTGATIALTNGQLVINKDLTITVVHPCDVTIDAQHNSRIFDVQANKALTLNELCLDNGFVDTSGDGGGIRVAGGASLTLNSVIMLGNRVQGSGPRGGAIYNNGTLSVNGNSDFFQNAAGNLTSNTNTGGAIFNDGAASLNGSTDSAGIRSIVLSNNSAALEGGAIFNNGTMTLSDVSLSSDSAFAGGAIVNNSGVMTLTETLVSSNHADTVGGGLVNEGAGELNVYDSTIVLED